MFYKEDPMFKFRIFKTIEDEVTADSFYAAFLEFRDRMSMGYYGFVQADVELIGEVTEEEASAPGD